MATFELRAQEIRGEFSGEFHEGASPKPRAHLSLTPPPAPPTKVKLNEACFVLRKQTSLTVFKTSCPFFGSPQNKD